MEHWTPEEYRNYINRKEKKGKYRNQKTEVDGHVFDSKAEADRYSNLKLMERSGLIKGFMIQPSFYLTAGIRYRADFLVCGADGNIWAEDVKGIETKEFKIKKKLFNRKYPWLELRVKG